MGEGLFSGYISNLKEEQEKIIAYLYKNPKDSVEYPKEYFTDFLCNTIFTTIQSCITESLPVNLEMISDRIIEPSITKGIIQEVIETEYVEENIVYIKEKLRLGHVKQNICTDLDGVAKYTLDTEDFNIGQVREFARKILEGTYDLERNDSSYTAEQLMEHYESILDKRAKGERRRSMGFDNLDRLLKRPGQGGEMFVIVGAKGSGKSVLLKGMENSLLNSKTCVVSFNIEMMAESNGDRLISMRTGLSLDDLLEQDKPEETQRKIKRAVAHFKTYKNYWYYKEPSLTLDEFESQIHKAKKHFKNLGVLPEDEYMVVTFDTLDMLEELSSAKNAYEIKKVVNRIHAIYRRHNFCFIPLLQSNENVIRGGKRFKKPEDCEDFTLQPEDVEGGASYSARARGVFAINRPMILKKRFFPDRKEEFDLETDVMYVNLVKHNDGDLGRCAFVFNENSFRLEPFLINGKKPIEKEEKK